MRCCGLFLCVRVRCCFLCVCLCVPRASIAMHVNIREAKVLIDYRLTAACLFLCLPPLCV